MSFQKAFVITTLGKHPGLFHIANESVNDGGGPRKRRRLTHLSADEKILRRKMKNRIAAQTARDRKKVLMEELEEKLAELEKEKEQLLKDNAELRQNQAVFEKENQYLKLKRNATPKPSPKAVATPSSIVKQPVCWSLLDRQEMGEAAVPCKTEPECPGSAEGTGSGSVSCGNADRFMFPDFEPDTLLHFLEELSAEMEDSSTSQGKQTATISTACVRHGESRNDGGEWGPGRAVVGSPAADVDSIKEVIHADHHYHKEEPTAEPAFSLSSVSVSSQLPSEASDKAFPVLLSQVWEGFDTALILPSDIMTVDDLTHSVTPHTSAAGCEAGNASSDLHSQQTDLTGIVNPPMANSAQGERSKIQSEATTFLSQEMLESLEGLLKLDNFTSVMLTNEQLLTAAPSSSDSASVTPCVEYSPEIQQQNEAMCSVLDLSQDIPESFLGLHPDSCSQEKECDSECPSPDSGFSETVEDADSSCSDISPSPVSLSCEDMESMVWQDSFVDLDLQLFPDVGI